MIQEIFPNRFNNNYLANASIGEKDFVLHYNGNSLLLKTNGDEFEIPQKKDFSEITDKTESTFLFTLNDVPCFLIWDNLMTDELRFIHKEISFFPDYQAAGNSMDQYCRIPSDELVLTK